MKIHNQTPFNIGIVLLIIAAIFISGGDLGAILGLAIGACGVGLIAGAYTKVP